MRYSEEKERSAEILRLALPLMAKQEAGFHPTSYTLWYEHAAGLNPGLSYVLDTRLRSGRPLTDYDVWQLHGEHIVARDAEALGAMQRQIRELLDETSRMATLAGNEASQFGHTLVGHRTQLVENIDADMVRRIVVELVSETDRMRDVTADLTRQLETSSREVETLTQRLETAQSEALLDPLTGLHNRRGFERVMSDRHVEEDGLIGCCLLLADIDLFKSINDAHGHLFGDKVIRGVANVIRATIKGRDIAARLGGEEFAVLLPQTSLEGAQALAEQIRIAVSQGRIRRPGSEQDVGQVTLSIGLACATPEDTLESLLGRADAAMYSAKHEGRNRVSLGKSTAG